MKNLLVAFAITCITAANAALAGIVDTALPTTLPGTGKKPVLAFTTTGVRTNADTAFTVTCSNTDKSNPVEYGVEVFDFDNTQLNNAGTGDANVVMGVGETKTITLSGQNINTAFYAEDVVSALASDPEQGSARIIATSPKLICAAYLVGSTNPPTPLSRLPLFKKAQQKGD